MSDAADTGQHRAAPDTDVLKSLEAERDASRDHRTRVNTLLSVDGIARVSTVATAGTMGALTRASLGGLENQLSGCGASALLVSDFTVHASALSATTVLSRADVCRRLAAG